MPVPKTYHLVTLGCGVKDKALMTRQYGKSIQFITHFGQLPAAVEKLLKWTFLYGDRRRIEDDRAFAKWLQNEESRTCTQAPP